MFNKMPIGSTFLKLVFASACISSSLMAVESTLCSVNSFIALYFRIGLRHAFTKFVS